jgi:nucleoside-diphosphate-sugar epimerase
LIGIPPVHKEPETMKVLLTGASGFVGMATLKTLHKHNINLIATSTSGNDVSGQEGIDWLRWDAAHDGRPPSDIEYSSLDAIVHLASPRQRKSFPENYSATLNTNTVAAVNLAEISARHKIHFVYASTGDVFGLEADMINEDEMVFSPISFYASTKASAEILLQPFSNLTTVTILRVFHPYGPGGDDFLVNRLLARVLDGQTIQLEKDGGILINPVWVNDLAEGIFQTIKARIGGTFHLAGKEVMKLEELVGLMANLTHREARLLISDQKATGGHAGKIVRAEDALGFFPKIGLRSGIQTLIDARAGQ